MSTTTRKTKNFAQLRERTLADDPARRERVARATQAILDGEKLSEVREARKGSQREIAEEIAVSQACISQIERGKDLYLSTLDRYVRAMGGRLEIAAVFPDERVILSIPSEE